MRKRLIVGLGLLVVATTSGLSYLYLRSQVYHPVVQMNLSNELSITAVLPEAKDAAACMRANERFIAPFTGQCKQCKVSAMRCLRELVGVERAMQEDAPVAHPVVIAKDLRLAVIGPPASAKAACQVMAADIVKRGVSSANCRLP